MASLSTYASRFLSSGLAASIRQGANDHDHERDHASDPLFYSHASVAPFSTANDRNNPYAPEYSLSSSDGLPTPPANHTQSGLLHSLTGASRYGPASFLQGGRTRPHHPARDSVIREIDDEEDVDLWRDERRMPGIASHLDASMGSDDLNRSAEQPTRSRSRSASRKRNAASASDSQNPFLADGDLDRDDASSVADSRVRDSTFQIYTNPSAARKPISSTQNAGRARGWLAHGSVADHSDSNNRSRSFKAGKNSLADRLPADIYRNPDNDLDEQDQEEEQHGQPAGSSYHIRSATNSSRFAKRSSHGPGHRLGRAHAAASRSHAPCLYSIYDEQSESAHSRSRSSSISASSVTESASDTDDAPTGGRTRKASHRPRVNRNRARNMSSTMRDPLLPPGGSQYHSRRSSNSASEDEDDHEHEHTPFGRARSNSRSPSHQNKEALDDQDDDQGPGVYVYPSPPARSGWGPWANRLALGKYKDKTAILVFAGAVAFTILLGISLSWGAKSPSPPTTPRTRPSSYYTITRSLPILIVMTLLSFGAAAANLVLLRKLGRMGGAKVLRYALMGVPLVLGLGWTWALAGSFIYDDEAWSGGGWSTTGLRIISVVPLALAMIFARMVWNRRKALSRSIAVVELSSNIVLEHPALIGLSLASLGVFLLLTIPFLFVFTRLFLVGHFGKPVGDSVEWRTDRRAAWLAWATLATWLWTWAVMRGIQRVTVAGVVSHWYFNRSTEDAAGADANKAKDVDRRQADDEFVYGEDDDSIYGPGPSAPGAYTAGAPSHAHTYGAGHGSHPEPTEIVRASFARATGPALGSICLAALVLSMVRVLTLIAESARRVSNATAERRTPRLLQPLTHVVALLAGLTGMLQGLSNLALVYVGITGDGFWAATKKSAQLATKRGVKGVLEGTFVCFGLPLLQG